MTDKINEIQARIRSQVPDQCRSPFFVWFRGRSGSTFLTDLLNSHPQIFCRKEDFADIRVLPGAEPPAGTQILERPTGKFFRRLHRFKQTIDNPPPIEALEHLYEIFTHGEPACGFKLKHPVQYTVFPEVMHELETLGRHIKVVHLTRKNVLKQAVSTANLERIRKLPEMNSCNLTKQVEIEPLELNVDRAVAHAGFFLRTEADFANVIQPFPNVHPVDYEELLNSPDEAVSRILRFLEVDDTIELQSKYKKATPDNIQSAISNYDQLVKAVEGTPFEQFLD